MSISSCLAWAMAVVLILSSSLTLSVSAQDTPPSITLTFYNDAGEPIEAATQTILRATCVNVNTDLLVGGYTSVVASELQAALNLYPTMYCTFLSKSTVGFWNNTDAVLNTLSVRYEGVASDRPGTLTDTPFPPNMYVQPRIPDPEDNGKGANPEDWYLDPEKGKIVIIIVALVLAIGVGSGLYSVYQAAQYKPPPKEKKFKGLQTKKIKKKDAYYRKSDKEANAAAPLLSNMTPPGTPSHTTNKTSKSSEAQLVSSSTTSSFSSPVSRGSMQERRTYEVPVLIDMQDTNLGNTSSNAISSSGIMASAHSQNNSPPRRGQGGSGPVLPTSSTGVNPSTITVSSSIPPPLRSNTRPQNVSAPSTSSPLALSSDADLHFTPPMTQLYQPHPQHQHQHQHQQQHQQQQQQQPQQQRSSFQPQPYQQYPHPPLQQQHQHQQPRLGPRLQQRPQRPHITTQYQPLPVSQSPPTSPTGRGGGGSRGGLIGRGGYGSPLGRGGYSGGGGGGYGQQPLQSYQGQLGRSMSPPARVMSPSGPTSPNRGRGSNEILFPLQPIRHSNGGYVLPPPSVNPGVQQQHRPQQPRPPRPLDSSRSR